MKAKIVLLIAFALSAILVVGCGNQPQAATPTEEHAKILALNSVPMTTDESLRAFKKYDLRMVNAFEVIWDNPPGKTRSGFIPNEERITMFVMPDANLMILEIGRCEQETCITPEVVMADGMKVDNHTVMDDQGFGSITYLYTINWKKGTKIEVLFGTEDVEDDILWYLYGRSFFQ